LPHSELHASGAPFTPTSVEEAVEYVLSSGLREISDYDGYPDIQRETAEDIVQRASESGSAFHIAISTYVEQNVTLAADQDNLLQEEVYLYAIMKGMQRRRLRDGAKHLASVVMLRQDLVTGESSVESQYVERTRSFA
jgi:hypothetical protein